MNQRRSSYYIYILIAIFFGLIVGVYLRENDVITVLGVVSIIGIAAIIWYMQSGDDQGQNKSGATDKDDVQRDEQVEVLSKEEARKWLDEFLVDHQRHIKKD